MRRLVLVTALVALSSPASAQSVVTLEEAIRLARDESPAARALGAEVAVAQAGVDLAGVYPNPALAYAGFGRFDGSNAAINGTQHQIWLDIPLLIAGQHEARRDAAAAAAVAQRAQLEVFLLELEIEARRSFAALLAAQDREARLTIARDELAQLQRIVEGRAGAGAQSQYDTTRMAIEMARIEADLASATAEARAAAMGLAALAGRTGWTPRAEGTLEAHDHQYGSIDDLPSVRAARARVVAAESDVRRAEIERVPEIRLGAGAYFTTDGDSSSAFLGLSIPLPVFDTGEAAVGRARAARDAASEAQRAVELHAQARLDGAVAVLDARRAALATFDAETFARLPELQQMAEASYRLGVSRVFELLDAFRARLEVQIARIDLLAAMVEAEIQIFAIVGR
jgi:cobalt-zinc-cadmium efflux system outer membrane protein